MFVIRDSTSSKHPTGHRLAIDAERGASVEWTRSYWTEDCEGYSLRVDGRQFSFLVQGNEFADPVTGEPYILHDILEIGPGFIPEERGVKPARSRVANNRRMRALIAAEGLVALRSYRRPGLPDAWPQLVKFDDEILDWPEYANGRTTREP